MGILDWFKNRPAQFDPDKLSDEILSKTIDKVVTLANPRLKLLDSYQARIAPAVRVTIEYFRECIQFLPAFLPLSATDWKQSPALRSFFVTPEDISGVLGRSANLKAFLKKFPTKEQIYLILRMKYQEQNITGFATQADAARQDITEKAARFSDHQIRVCGESELEIRRLLGTQGIEYLVAQALAEIGKERTGRQELQEERLLIRARLRMLQQHGPGLGSVFANAPEDIEEQARLEARLLENEHRLKTLSNPENCLSDELETLCQVFGQPEQYIKVERKTMKLSSMNVVLDDTCQDAVSEIDFSLVTLSGTHSGLRVFVLAHVVRSDVPEVHINLAEAERYL